MSYYVNVASMRWFYKEVLPLVRKEKPEVQLKIVGRNPPTGILRFMKDNQVEVTGNVPDVRPYLAQAAVAICPMVTGSGIQNKLLEAMAAGTPCVVSPIAAQALQARNGEEMLIGENAQKFADCVLKLLRDRSLGEKLSYQARQYVERSHNWQAVGGGLDTIYQGLFTSKEKRDG
jgi:glycosyltransferase involved in cell wall biosynthesis